METLNAEQLILEQSVDIAQQMLEITQWAESEEDVRYECNKLIDAFIKKAGLQIKARHEYSLAGGRIDSKYGGVIIEYKDPKGAGKITEDASAPGTKAVVEQIKKRFKDFQVKEKIEPDRIFGVGCDGDTLIFVRHRSGKFEVGEPQPVTPHTVQRLLRAIVSLGAQGYSFTPEHLSAHFGADSLLAQEGVRDIYNVITETKSRKAKTFFNQWKILFGEVCGYDVEGRNEKINKLGSHYLIHDASPAELLFSVHTYYAVFIKFLAAEIVYPFSPLGIRVLKKCVEAPTSGKLKQEMKNLEQGGIWSQLGITNFLEGDLFSWYLDAWDDKMAEVIRKMVNKLDAYDPGTLSVDPIESRDLLKKLYQHLFPKSVRHDLGEYYTPDWLAEHVLNELGYEGDPDKRLLDPACGSGTFLVMAINRIKKWFEEHRHECGYGEKELIQKIRRNIIGFDLNPLAVMAARTNYLLAIRDLLKFSGDIEIPVYLCDSIMTPALAGSHKAQQTFLVESKTTFDTSNPPMAIKTAAGIFLVPAEIATSREQIGKYADNIERCIRDNYSAKEFIVRCEEDGLPITEKDLHRKLYEQLSKLDADNQNGIWARIIKNAFAPLFIDRVDYIAGNPPWVNWESLPEDYRDAMKPLWRNYGLFSLSGSAGRLGGGKKDLSMLFLYSSIDNYLLGGGKLGFVITQTVFKTKGAGDGFRRLRFQRDKKTIVLKPVTVHDLSDMQVFEGATNRTAVFVCKKDSKDFEYPVPYTIWRGPSRIGQDESLEQVEASVKTSALGAIPVEPGKITSPWLTAPKKALVGIQKVIGKSEYKAYEGVNTGGLNGCFWIRVLEKLKDGNLVIENLYDVGKIKVQRVEAVVEPDLVYPLLRGRDVKRWNAEPSAYIILAQDPQTRRGIPESDMKQKYPKTYAYFKQFEGNKDKPVRGTLRGRALYKKYFKPTDPFYSMYNVGPYTIAPWKVIWNRIDTKLQGVVVGPNEEGNTVICQETHTLVNLEGSNEAHYFTAIFNSAPSDLLVRCYSVSKGFASAHVLESISIPQYEQNDNLHSNLSNLSQDCHTAAAKDGDETVAELEKEIDKAASKLWGITDDELKTIQDALKDMEKGKGKRKRKK